MKITIPGKIFISGEYAALKGMPALSVAVNPGFVFKNSSSLVFHPDSPAGRIHSQLTGDFFDPYNNMGGLGRSTAEFIAAIKNLNPNENDIWTVWEQYRGLFLHEKNIPSGVDLLTQISGGYCQTWTSKKRLKQKPWPFLNLDWVALVTGNKVKTHIHLAETLNLDWDQVEKINQNINMAFETENEENFVESINEWRSFLKSNHLETPASSELVDFFLEIPGVVAAKGCGALGSDVIFIMFKKNEFEILKRSLEFWNPQHVISSNQVNYQGVQVLNEHENVSSL